MDERFGVGAKAPTPFLFLFFLREGGAALSCVARPFSRSIGILS